MPSPLAHSSVALLCWPLLVPRENRLSKPRKLLLAGALLFATIAPDADFAMEFVLGRDPRVGHGTYTHSLLALAVFSVLFAGFLRLLVRASLLRLWAVSLLAYGSHLLLDCANRGRGIALLWPWSDERISFPRWLFVGVRHSDLWDFRHHALTIANESVFVLIVACIAFGFSRWRDRVRYPR